MPKLERPSSSIRVRVPTACAPRGTFDFPKLAPATLPPPAPDTLPRGVIEEREAC